jgi:hypothetical protein
MEKKLVQKKLAMGIAPQVVLSVLIDYLFQEASWV